MDTSQIVNSVGLAIDIIGATIMFVNTPKVHHRTYLYTKSERRTLDAADERTNKSTQRGFAFLFVGFAIQLISNFL
jgi:hypothetical protein